jgi:hypothetical protein
MHLPALCLRTGDFPLKDAATRSWLQAVGERPTLPPWRSVRRRKHVWLHALALKAKGYASAYEELPVEKLMADHRYSVEHVVPRSKIDDASDAEADPYNWIQATRRANSRRSNYPLKLWSDEPGVQRSSAWFEWIDGQLHYVPPEDQRARIARKWLYTHATYPHDTDAPSIAQLRNLSKIVALARDSPIGEAEQQVADALRDLLGYANPLLTEDAHEFYEILDWYELLGGEEGRKPHDV